MKIAVVTDSASDLPNEVREAGQIHVVPIRVLFGEDQFRDQVDITPEQFFDKLNTSGVLPSTSQPSPADFINLYEILLKKHDAVISLHISEKLSGTYQSACIARDAVSPNRIEVIDTRAASMAQGFIAMEALQAAAAGSSREHVLHAVQKAMDTTRLAFTVDSLEHLMRNGRIGKAASMFGSLLSVKPIIALEDGELTPMAKVRGSKRVLECVMECIRKDVGNGAIKVAVIHTNTHDRAREWFTAVQGAFVCKEAYLVQCGAVIGTHVGPTGLGVAWMPADQ
ncbi:MAG TPA: DegV family protein [Bacillota bacterium]|nr:DegV family protein [Bacillota bacterium]